METFNRIRKKMTICINLYYLWADIEKKMRAKTWLMIDYIDKLQGGGKPWSRADGFSERSTRHIYHMWLWNSRAAFSSAVLGSTGPYNYVPPAIERIHGGVHRYLNLNTQQNTPNGDLVLVIWDPANAQSSPWEYSHVFDIQGPSSTVY